MREVKGILFTTPQHTQDLNNLLLPLDMTVFTYGITQSENKTCYALARTLDIVDLLKEYGLVMVILEGTAQIRIAGAEAIQIFLDEYMSRKVGSDVSLENIS
jgi:hypothetical protein